MDALVRQDATPAVPVFDDSAVDAVDRVVLAADASEITCLYDALDRVSVRQNPRSARLLTRGRTKIAQKLIEEAGEVALEAARRRNRGVVRESADLIYQLVVLWRQCGIAPAEVWAEMRHRADVLGIAEKLPKSVGRHAFGASEEGRRT